MVATGGARAVKASPSGGLRPALTALPELATRVQATDGALRPANTGAARAGAPRGARIDPRKPAESHKSSQISRIAYMLSLRVRPSAR